MPSLISRRSRDGVALSAAGRTFGPQAPFFAFFLRQLFLRCLGGGMRRLLGGFGGVPKNRSHNLQLHRSKQNDRCRAHYCTLDRSACHRQRSYRLQPPCKPISGYDAFRWNYTSLRANRWRGPRRRRWQSQRATPRHSAEAAACRYRSTTPSTSRSRPRRRRCARAIRTATGARSCSGRGWGNHPPWTRGRRRRRGATPRGAAGEVPRRVPSHLT